MARYEEHSEISRKNALLIAGCVLILISLVSYTAYNWVVQGKPNVFELGLEIAGFYVLADRIFSRYKYSIEAKAVKVEKKGLFGTNNWEVTHKEIVSLARYAPESLWRQRYRRTFRVNSTLDGRPVWVLVYRDHGKENRLFLKPSEAFIQHLREKIPQKIKA